MIRYADGMKNSSLTLHFANMAWKSSDQILSKNNPESTEVPMMDRDLYTLMKTNSLTSTFDQVFDPQGQPLYQIW